MPAPSVAEDVQAPGVDEHGGRGAERDDVGERVVLLAELARRAELARHEAVERVEDRGEEERPAGVLEAAGRPDRCGRAAIASMRAAWS